MIPTAGGSVAAGSAGKAKSALKPAAKEKLKRVSPSVAKQLDSVATSPAYGAPADPPASSATTKPVTQKPVTQKAPTKVVAAAKKVDGPAKPEAAKPRPVLSEPIPPAPTLGSTGSAVLLGISDQGSLGFLLLTLVVGSGIAALATTIQRRRI